jgi:5-methylcytosine-specific restriction endonuclease McrA
MLKPETTGDLGEHERKERSVTPALREVVLERDNHQCVSCGTAGENRLQLHHLVFRSQGGGHNEENLVTLCFECHEDVHRTLLQLALLEYTPGQFSWFCARKRPPRRWQQTFFKK